SPGLVTSSMEENEVYGMWRRTTRSRSVCLALVLASTGFQLLTTMPRVCQADDEKRFELVGAIPLPGVSGRFDHFACDASGGRVFVAALGNNTLEVVDFKQLKRVRSVTGLREPTGVLFSAGGLIQVANGDDGSVRAYESSTFTMAARLAGLEDADNMRCDAATSQVYVGYGDGALAIVDSALTRLVASIPLPGHPESFQLERK